MHYRSSFATILILALAVPAWAQKGAAPKAKPKSSAPAAGAGAIVDERAAAKLLDAGSARYEADEVPKAVEIWQSVIERYPKSKARFQAHMLLGNYYLDRDRAYDRARVHFEQIASEENRDEGQRAEATLKCGMCYFHARNYGKCFVVLRDVIEKFPTSQQVNQAYYYIGLGHYNLGHYSRAIAALEKVGSTLGSEEGKVEKLEAGKRFFIRVEDADLAVLDSNQPIEVVVETAGGDRETVKCFPVGRHVRLVMGSIPTQLGKALPDNGELEVRGGDKVKVTYIDEHTADKVLNRKVLCEVPVVGNAVARITDGAFRDSLGGLVLGKPIHVQISDADGDTSDKADTLRAAAEVWRLKTEEEVADEKTKARIAALGEGAQPAAEDDESDDARIDPYKLVDRAEIVLTEVALERPAAKANGGDKSDVKAEQPAPAPDAPAAAAEPAKTDADRPEKANGEKPAKGKNDKKARADRKPAEDQAAQPPAAALVAADGIHTGVFRGTLSLEKSEEVKPRDNVLQAMPGDLIRVVYVDKVHRGSGERIVKAEARCLEGNIGGVRVTQAEISDDELRFQTMLKTASALTNIGNRYKEFGLKEHAKDKYKQALVACEDVLRDARKAGGAALEQTYVQLWQIYFEMDELALAAAMCQRLQKEFPASGFVDEAMLKLAQVTAKQGEYHRAINAYTRLVEMSTSQLRGEAQFGIAECFEMLAKEGGGNAAAMQERAFQEYKKVYERFPQSGRVGEAVAKMASHYYQQRDYARAVDTFETVLGSYPDAKFMDVILFNYGRCLYRLNRKDEALKRFDQLLAEFPDSPFAGDAKKAAELLAKPAATATGAGG